MKFVIPEMMPAAPEIFVFSMACAILVLDLFLSDRRRVVSYWLAQGTLGGAAAFERQGTLGAPFSPLVLGARTAVAVALCHDRLPARLGGGDRGGDEIFRPRRDRLGH